MHLNTDNHLTHTHEQDIVNPSHGAHDASTSRFSTSTLEPTISRLNRLQERMEQPGLRNIIWKKLANHQGTKGLLKLVHAKKTDVPALLYRMQYLVKKNKITSDDLGHVLAFLYKSDNTDCFAGALYMFGQCKNSENADLISQALHNTLFILVEKKDYTIYLAGIPETAPMPGYKPRNYSRWDDSLSKLSQCLETSKEDVSQQCLPLLSAREKEVLLLDAIKYDFDEGLEALMNNFSPNLFNIYQQLHLAKSNLKATLLEAPNHLQLEERLSQVKPIYFDFRMAFSDNSYVNVADFNKIERVGWEVWDYDLSFSNLDAFVSEVGNGIPTAEQAKKIEQWSTVVEDSMNTLLNDTTTRLEEVIGITGTRTFFNKRKAKHTLIIKRASHLLHKYHAYVEHMKANEPSSKCRQSRPNGAQSPPRRSAPRDADPTTVSSIPDELRSKLTDFKAHLGDDQRADAIGTKVTEFVQQCHQDTRPKTMKCDDQDLKKQLKRIQIELHPDKYSTHWNRAVVEANAKDIFQFVSELMTPNPHSNA